jgi:hypothetical protein
MTLIHILYNTLIAPLSLSRSVCPCVLISPFQQRAAHAFREMRENGGRYSIL